MNRLLHHYNEELRALRELAGPFAAQHPKVAGRLRLAGDMVEDPFVGRLLEGVALLNARIAQRLDDDFLPFCESMLQVLSPHLMAPVPSLTVVAFEPANPTQDVQHIPAGFQMDSEAVREHHCRFQTCYPVALWPVQIKTARLHAAPFEAPRHAAGAAAVLRLTLEATAPDGALDRLALDRLRLFISAESQRALQLHELLFGCCLGVAYATSPNEDAPARLPPDALHSVGFAPDEAILGTMPGSDAASRLLLEHFAFPEKFLFFDLTGLDQRLLRGVGRTLEVYVYLSRTDPALERTISAEDFALNATPAINLFAQSCEPVRLDTSRSAQRLVPDARREAATEIHSVEAVSLAGPDGQVQAVTRLHGPVALDAQDAPLRYALQRLPSPLRTGGSDVFITLADRTGQPLFGHDHTLIAQALCFNRDLPSRLPFGGGRPGFFPVSGDRHLRTIRCVTRPTSACAAPAGPEAAWRLVSLLHLNHVHFSDHPEALQHLRTLLGLLDVRATPQTRALMQRLVGLEARASVARAPVAGHVGFCTGVDVTLRFDETVLSGSGSFLFAMVLERFFAGQVPVNSFARTHARLVDSATLWREGRALCGSQSLL